jgi:hypothetical protein
MSNIHGDLSSYKTDKPVQDKQKAVVSDLDVLIAKLQPKGGGSSTGNTPNGGRKKSLIVDAQGMIGDLHGTDPAANSGANSPQKNANASCSRKPKASPPATNRSSKATTSASPRKNPPTPKPQPRCHQNSPSGTRPRAP